MNKFKRGDLVVRHYTYEIHTVRCADDKGMIGIRGEAGMAGDYGFFTPEEAVADLRDKLYKIYARRPDLCSPKLYPDVVKGLTATIKLLEYTRDRSMESIEQFKHAVEKLNEPKI